MAAAHAVGISTNKGKSESIHRFHTSDPISTGLQPVTVSLHRSGFLDLFFADECEDSVHDCP